MSKVYDKCLVLVHPAVPRTKKHKPGVTEPIQMIEGHKTSQFFIA